QNGDAPFLSLPPGIEPAAAAASRLGLPGADGVPFPEQAWQAAPRASDLPVTRAASVEFPPYPVGPFDIENGVAGVLNLTHQEDTFAFYFPLGNLVRLFLEYDGPNADLFLTCTPTGRTWASYSALGSNRRLFDSVTVVNNWIGSTPEAAFSEFEEPSCYSGEYTVTVRRGEGAPFIGDVRYLLRGHMEPFNGTWCNKGDEGCGLNWARWGDRCKEAYTPPVKRSEACRAHEAAYGRGNNRSWAYLDANNRENPVVFVHGVGSDSTVWTAVEKQGFYHLSCLDCVKLTKLIITTIALGATLTVAVLAMHEIISTGMFVATAPNIVSAMYGIALVSYQMYELHDKISKITEFLKGVLVPWRKGDTADTKGYFWELKSRGFETYWVEYNYRDNNARFGQIKMASRQLRAAVSAIQQDFFERHRHETNFPHRAPEDVEVDIVAHSMGGLVSRLYTVDPETVVEGTFESWVYEGDVNKLIQIQTPNQGATIATFLTVGPVVSPLIWIQDLMMTFLFRHLGLKFVPKEIQDQIVPPFSDLKKIFFKMAAASLVTFFIAIVKTDRVELARYNPFGIIAHMNRLNPAPDVDHGLIYGKAFEGIPGLGDTDGLVTVTDAKGPGKFIKRAATLETGNDHGSGLHAERIRDTLVTWLLNPDGLDIPDPPEPEENDQGGNGAATTGLPLPLVSTASVSVSTNTSGSSSASEPATANTASVTLSAVQHSLLLDFGQDPGTSGGEPGAGYVPEGGALAGPTPGRESLSAVGDRTARLERLAAQKGLTGAAATFAAFGALGQEAANDLVAASGAGQSAFDEAMRRQGAASGHLLQESQRNPDGSLDRITDLAADIAVLRAVHAKDAESLLNRIGEPAVRVDAFASPSELAKRDLLIVPTGALAGTPAATPLARNLDRFTRDGGTLLVFAQRTGHDLAAVPGGLRAFGFSEEDASYRGAALLGGFTPALAGQRTAAPDLHVDGSFTAWPENATVLLMSAKNGRPLAVSYAWGAGRVVALALVSDWARGAGRATPAEETLLRDLVAAARAPA
ncbi:MAG TPA: hypothetical protein VNZ52_08625, partial [Candidatus Thermoplasmatota archaeon]|nr:hypothetical protein [Candidatus Thermoplasmatota archaeon]